jgi:Tfp pilus tip-associated adhesin PilY1
MGLTLRQLAARGGVGELYVDGVMVVRDVSDVSMDTRRCVLALGLGRVTGLLLLAVIPCDDVVRVPSS